MVEELLIHGSVSARRELVHHPKEAFSTLLLAHLPVSTVHSFRKIQYVADEDINLVCAALVSTAVEGLEGRIRDLAYRAKDIIESHFSDQIGLAHDSCGLKKGLKQLISALQTASSLKFRKEEDKDLQKVMEKINSIVEQVMSIEKVCKVEDVQCSYPSAPAASRVVQNDGSKMVGFDGDLLELKARLCGESSNLQIISIVGMGGIGNTTLARNIFDDLLVAYHFHGRAWIAVSQDYRLGEVLPALVDSLTDRTVAFK
ncbi:putative disease resistance RPP8-like protein 2 [Sesamum angolense]|uniref:Disease resistance RPP8-like protein 2 n=1 Tax=Sesamum angolense TaxID=2727404 RepID=A0AAE1XFG9_9LAMI|nr:putative disease resistance RPP8-like protein 2 [Sesamum angolense]